MKRNKPRKIAYFLIGLGAASFLISTYTSSIIFSEVTWLLWLVGVGIYFYDFYRIMRERKNL